MGFFDKTVDTTTVNTFKQFFNRTDREIFLTDIPQTGTVHKNMLYWKWKSTKPHVGRLTPVSKYSTLTKSK